MTSARGKIPIPDRSHRHDHANRPRHVADDRRTRGTWNVSFIIERTQAGMKEARRSGVKFGRKPKLSPAQVAKARKLIEHGERVEAVAELWNVGRSTRYRELAGSLVPTV